MQQFNDETNDIMASVVPAWHFSQQGLWVFLRNWLMIIGKTLILSFLDIFVWRLEQHKQSAI